MGRILLFKCTCVLLKSLKLKYIDTLKYFTNHCAMCLVAQSCLTLWDPMDCSPPGSSVCRDSPGKNIGVGCHALLQRIFLTQGLNPCLLHCRWILYHLNCQGMLVKLTLCLGKLN